MDSCSRCLRKLHRFLMVTVNEKPSRPIQYYLKHETTLSSFVFYNNLERNCKPGFEAQVRGSSLNKLIEQTK